MRKLLFSLVVGAIFLFNTLGAVAESSVTKSIVNTTMLDSGIVKVAYSSSNAKLKVMIEKDSRKYTYDLNNDGVEESFSLQLGNGQYKVSVLENIGGTKYRSVSAENVNLNISDTNKVYLASIQNINWNEESAAIKKAEELTKGLTDDSDKLKAIYNYIVSNLNYDYDKLNKLKSDYLPDIDATLASKTGICYDYSSTFAAMLRSVGIPTKLIKGYSTNVNGYHAWNEVYNTKTDSWMIIDTTYDSQLKAAKMKYTMEKASAEYTKSYQY